MNKHISALDLSCVDSIVLNMSYGLEDGPEGGFRLYVQKLDPSGFFVLVVAKNYVNPAERARETFSKMLKVFNAYGIPSAKVSDSIYLDLLEMKGHRNEHLYKWNFCISNKDFSDELIPVGDAHLASAIENAWQNYYAIRSSIITDSPLSIRDKAELVAMYFRDICFDEVSIETVVKHMRNALHHFKNKGDTSVAWLKSFCKAK